MGPPTSKAPHSSAAPPPVPAPQVSFAAIVGTSSTSAPKDTTTPAITQPPTAGPTATPAVPATAAPAPKRSKYPPLVVESLPNWAHHFRALKEKLGRAPNARPFGKGIRFSPDTEEEYRVIQRYLTTLEREERISWFSYSLPQERSLKVAIRGVPLETDPEEISADLRNLGFDPELVRPIRARKGRPGCIYFAILRRTPDLTPAIYDTTELLCMPGVTIEAWRGKKGPAQCHRCQKFRHSSHHCHRTQACVRCGEEHSAHNCPRPREEPATCANCGGPHPANNISCPVFRREARNKRAGTVAVSTGQRTKPTATAEPKAKPPQKSSETITIIDVEALDEQESSGSKIRTPANLPTNRGDALPKRKKKNKKKKTVTTTTTPTTTSTAQTTTRTPTASSAPTTNGKLAILETAITVLQEVLIALRTGNEPADVVLRDLKTLLSTQDVDLALLNETHLSAADTFKIAGYHIYRYDDPSGTKKRGVMILIRRRIIHQPLPQPQPQLSSLQAIGVELLIGRTPYRFFAVYRPPAATLALADVHNLLDSPLPTVIAGDWNAKNPAWNSASTNATGRRLLADAESRNYVITGPEVPTFYPYQASFSPDVLDIVVHRGLPCDPTLEVVVDELGSDHLPVLMSIRDAAHTIRTPPRKRTNWKTFYNILSESTPTHPVRTPEDVDSLAEALTECIQKAMDSSTALPTAMSLKKDPLPRALQNLMQAKKNLRRRWQDSRCPRLKAALNRTHEKCKAQMAQYRSLRWESRIDDASEDIPSLHRLCRQLTKAPDPIRPLLHRDGTPRYRAQDRANIFAEHLESQFQTPPSQDCSHTATVEQHLRAYFAEPIQTEEDPLSFSPGMVQRAIERTKPRKAPGADGITNMALRHMPRRTIAAMTRLFNGILRTGRIPHIWKIGHVIMLPKPQKNVLKAESYRPITLLSSCSKVFERLLLPKLVPHIVPREEQFGFRAEHSTTHQLQRVIHTLTAAFNKKESAASVFLDMEKAFDRVWHAGLLYKLSTSSAPRRIILVIKSFLEGRTFNVRVDGALSESHPVSAGVPQGSCLSPVLYSRYTDDIPVVAGTTLALYADDAAYIATSLSTKHAAIKLQRCLNSLPEWLAKWRLSANPMKTQAIVMGLSTKTPPPLQLLGTVVPWSAEVKYLGVTIDRNLTMKTHIRRVTGQTKTAAALLRPVLRSRLPLRTKLGVYKTYIRSRLTYAAPAWFALVSETNKKTLRSQQAQALRKVVDAPRFVRNSTIQRDLRVESLDTFISRLAERLFARAKVSTFPHIRDVAPYHSRPPDRKPYPRDLLG